MSASPLLPSPATKVVDSADYVAPKEVYTTPEGRELTDEELFKVDEGFLKFVKECKRMYRGKVWNFFQAPWKKSRALCFEIWAPTLDLFKKVCADWIHTERSERLKHTLKIAGVRVVLNDAGTIESFPGKGWWCKGLPQF